MFNKQWQPIETNKTLGFPPRSLLFVVLILFSGAHIFVRLAVPILFYIPSGPFWQFQQASSRNLLTFLSSYIDAMTFILYTEGMTVTLSLINSKTGVKSSQKNRRRINCAEQACHCS